MTNNIIYPIISGLIIGIIKGWQKIPVNHLLVILLLFFNLTKDLHHATATVSFITLGFSLIYAFKHYNKIIDIDIELAIIIFFFILIGAYIGNYLSKFINTKVTNISIIIGFVITIIYLIYYFKIF